MKKRNSAGRVLFDVIDLEILRILVKAGYRDFSLKKLEIKTNLSRRALLVHLKRLEEYKFLEVFLGFKKNGKHTKNKYVMITDFPEGFLEVFKNIK